MIYFNNSFCSLFILPFLLITACSTPTDTKVNSDAEKDILLTRIEQFNTAFETGDVKTLESMITDKYVHTNSSAKAIGRDQWVDYLQRRKKDLDSGDLIVGNYALEETEVEIYGDMAILTGKISFSSERSGEQKENEIRITNVWVKEDGAWKRAGFHDTRIR